LHNTLLTSLSSPAQICPCPACTSFHVLPCQTLLEHIHRAISIQSRISGTSASAAASAPAARQHDYDDEDEEEEYSGDSEDSDGDEDDAADNDDAEEEEEEEEETDARVDRLVARNESEPLNREEIGKLLILTSRAYASKILSPNQRSFLKTQIVAQHGMLRVVLQFPTLESIMSALKTISSSVDED